MTANTPPMRAAIAIINRRGADLAEINDYLDSFDAKLLAVSPDGRTKLYRESKWLLLLTITEDGCTLQRISN